MVYHLFGGQLGLRVHPHVERSFRLKTEASRGISKLQAAHSEIGENPIRNCGGKTPADFGKRCVQQRNLRPISICRRDAGATEPFPRDFQRRRIFIEPNQMTRRAEAFCDF